MYLPTYKLTLKYFFKSAPAKNNFKITFIGTV